MSTSGEAILDPTGDGDLATDTTLAPRVSALRGRTLGLLDNGKPNGSVLLSEVGRYLQEEHRLGDAHMYTKSYFGTPVEEVLVDNIRQECDIAVAAVGD